MLLSVIKDTLVFYLFIKIANGFEIPKHYLIAFYKVHSNVYPIESQHNNYAVYVAGKVAYLTIQTPNVTNIAEILSWRAINTDPACLMFVSENKPFMLINSTIIRPMSYTGSLSGTIIELGDNEALHIPNITNSNEVKPEDEWNFLELLYFDSRSERVEMISSIPWLDDNDWRYILEYRILDHINSNNKLYLLMFRKLNNTSSSQSYNEIFIIRLCLDKGSQFFSSAVEIHYSYPSNPISAVFHLKFSNHLERKTYAIVLINNQSSLVTFHYIENFENLFDDVAYNCSTGLPGHVNLFHHHLRMVPDKCVEDVYQDCHNDMNFFPSGQISDKIIEKSFPGPEDNLVGLNTHHYGYPPYFITFEVASKDRKYICNSTLHCEPSFYSDLQNYYQKFHVDVIHGKIIVAHRDNTVTYIYWPCFVLEDCFHCTVLANRYCQWVKNNQGACQAKTPENLNPYNYINFCYQIVQIKPSKIVADSPVSLEIRFSDPLIIKQPYEFVTISAGPDSYCTNIKFKDKIIYCDLYFEKYGNFFVNVTFDAVYADATQIYSLSLHEITIVPKRKIYTKWLLGIFIISTIIVSLAFYCSVYSPANFDMTIKYAQRLTSNLYRSKSMVKTSSNTRKKSNQFLSLLYKIKSKRSQ